MKNNIRKPIVTVLSSYARDMLIDEENQLLRVQRGGPALFISQVLDDTNTPYVLKTYQDIEVEIRVTASGEFGRIKKSPISQEPKIQTQNVLVSTLVDEWPLAYKNFTGNLWIDIQGFVREPQNFGVKKSISLRPSFQPFCIKGTEEEINYLPPAFTKDQKNRLLITTNGSAGSTVFFKGKKYQFKPDEVIVSRDTLGAGDTFFASFFAEFIKTADPKLSGRFATVTTSNFLRNKKHH